MRPAIFLYNAFFFSALAELSASRAALIIATNPALTAVATWLVFRQRFAWWQWVGVATAFAGVAIVVSRGDIALVSDAVGLGEVLMFGGAVSWVVYTLVGRSLMQRQDALSPLATTAYASGVGLLLLATAAIFELPQVQWTRIGLRELVAVGYLGLLGTAVGFVWFYEGVKTLGAARASVFTNLVPVFGVALAVLLLGEPLLASMIVGGLVTLAGVSLTNVPKKTTEPRAQAGAVQLKDAAVVASLRGQDQITVRLSRFANQGSSRRGWYDDGIPATTCWRWESPKIGIVEQEPTRWIATRRRRMLDPRAPSRSGAGHFDAKSIATARSPACSI